MRAAFGAALVALAVVLLLSDYTHKPGSAAKTPETSFDAWLGTGIMAGVATVILVLAEIFGGPDRLANMLRFMPLATLGPGAYREP